MYTFLAWKSRLSNKNLHLISHPSSTWNIPHVRIFMKALYGVLGMEPGLKPNRKNLGNSNNSVLNSKIMEFFKIIIPIGVLNSKIVLFKTKFEGHKLYWHNFYYQIHH